jgi:hypothetical protein
MYTFQGFCYGLVDNLAGALLALLAFAPFSADIERTLR